MSRKEKTTIYIDGAVKRKALEFGLNISKVCENALTVITNHLSDIISKLGSGFEPEHQAGRSPFNQAEAYRPVEPGAGVQISLPAHTNPHSAGGSSFILVAESQSEMLDRFRRFLTVDLQRKRLTVQGHVEAIQRFLTWLGDKRVTRSVLRDYLDLYRDKSSSTYANQLKALKVFYRDFLGRPDLVASFKFPGKEIELKRIPSKDKLRKFYYALEKLDIRMACYFLLYATTGWRRREVMALHLEDVDLEARTMTPRLKSSSTKGRLIGCFNQEAAEKLKQYLATRKDKSPKLLPISERTFRRLWHQAAKDCGFMVQPQELRDWFCEEMGNLGVPDRYIDAFCGRVPKSILAKHYTDYAAEKLKRIYDKAGLKVLS